jgi:hypothetical protein
MKKSILLLLSLLEVIILCAQPSEFKWRARSDTNYISSAKDQEEQGPCGIFAAVGAIEALSHIYYNKPFSVSSVPNTLNLAEEELKNKLKNLPIQKNRSLQNERFFFLDEPTGLLPLFKRSKDLRAF